MATWAALAAATTVSWYLGDGHGPRRVISAVVLAVAFAKVYVVAREFMELRGAPALLHGLFATWCAVVCALLISLYLML